MDVHFSGGDTVIKTRKPYTMSKERVKWTNEEQDRFLEGLKLYGRAWPRIREHVGTKTSAQIRSHAQKFFAKLENKTSFKGVPRVEAPDLDIPPPRQKRKSINPYPRNTTPASLSSQPEIRDEKLVTPRPVLQSKLILDFEKEKVRKKSTGEEQTTNEKENQDHNPAEMGNLLHEELGSIALKETSFVSPMAALGNSSPMAGFLPSEKEQTDGDAQKFFLQNSFELCSLPGCGGIQQTQNYPSYVAVNIGSIGTSFPETHLKENPSSESHDSDTRFILRSSQDLYTHYIPLCHNPDVYIHGPPTNPAAHAAAMAGAAVCNQRCFCCMRSNSCPCAAAMASVTVAASPAWWATHGLVPLSVPCHAALNCAPSFGNSVSKPHSMFEPDHLNNCRIASWKEVSHEGRPAFQVLYTRDVNPKAISPQQDAATQERIDTVKHIEEHNIHLPRRKDKSSLKNKSPKDIENVGKGKNTIVLGNRTINNHQTGFKPYKR